MVDSTSSCSASARKPTCPRLTPSSGVPLAWVISAARRMDAVAADDQGELAARPRVLGARRRARWPAQRPGVQARGPRPPRPAGAPRCRDRSGRSRRRGPPRGVLGTTGVRQHQHPAHVVRVGAGAVARSSVHPLTRHPQRPGALHLGGDLVGADGRGPAPQQQEELHVARRARQRAGRHRDGAPARAARRPRRRRSPPRRAAPRSRTTPPLPTRSLPTSNCGLTIRARSPVGRGHRRAAGRGPARGR